MLNPDKKYCYEKAAPKTSALYYSLRDLTSEQRDLVVAVHAFYREIEDVMFECNDHELMLVKFNWWRGEVAKLATDEVSHPVLRFLKSCHPKSDVTTEKLFAIIDGFEQASLSPTFATFEDVVIHYMRTAGERELLIQSLLQTTLDTEKLFQAMLVIELVNYLQQSHRYIQRNFIYFAQDELNQFGVQYESLYALKTTPEIKKLLQHQAEKITRAYAQATVGLSAAQRDELSCLLIRCEIACKTLQAIQEDDYQVLENFITLTPLRFWWIAWKT